MRPLTLVCLLLLFSCNKKTVQLPEISHSEITEITDLSPAYIFYDETQPDGVKLNRKNLIISTNWIVNVDKRLNLSQVVPKVQILQEKRRNASIHKNETAKDYFSCHDTSIKNLGFLEFTNIEYRLADPSSYNKQPNSNSVFISTNSLEKIEIMPLYGKRQISTAKLSDFINKIDSISKENDERKEIILAFSKNLTFQDYITIKSQLNHLNDSHIISNQEFIY